MMRANTVFLFAMAILVCGLLGCATTGSKVSYGDATAVETVSTDFGSTDLQQIAEKEVSSLLAFPPIVELTNQRRPVVFIDSIKNKTREEIDTESITDTLSTKLTQSGKFRFADMNKVNEVIKQLQFQTSGGLVDPNTASQFGKQIGAEFMLYGNFSDIVKRDNRTKDVYYKFTLKLLNVETGIIEWMDEKEIRKTSKRKVFGS